MLIIYIFVALVVMVSLGYLGYQLGIKNSLDNTTIPLFVLNKQGGLVYRNSAAKDFALPTLTIAGSQFISTDMAIYLKSISGQSRFYFEFRDDKREREFKFEGREFWYQAEKHWLVSVRRQVEKASAELNSKQSKALIHHLFQRLPDAVGMMNDDFVYEACNSAFVNALGIKTPEELLGRRLEDVASEEIAEKFVYSDKRVLETGEDFHIIDETINDGGERQWLEARKIAYTDPVTNKRGLFIFARDISDKELVKQKLHAANRGLRRLSFLDGLTNLGNRRYFEETLDSEWNSHMISHHPISLIKCKIESLSKIKEQFSIEVVDELIVEVTKLLEQATLRVEDRIYRYSEDEFSLILTNADDQNADIVVRRIEDKLELIHSTQVAKVIERYLVIRVSMFSCQPSLLLTQTMALAELNKAAKVKEQELHS